MIARTAWTDDDGSLTTGTIINNAEKTALYDQIDGRWSQFDDTAVGTQNNYAFAQADYLKLGPATALTITGFLAPASPLKPGKRITIVNLGVAQINLVNESGSSTAANRLATLVGGATISLAPGGRATLVYDSSAARWVVVVHEQGDWITYTPAWVGSSTQPAIVNGTLTGRYYLSGRVVRTEILVIMGAGTTYGTGSYTFSLPLTAASAFGVLPVWILDSSAGSVYLATARIVSTTTIDLWGTANPSAIVGQTSPVTFATSDQIWVAGTYRL